MILSKRLLALASFYSNESHVWDIGCDHGNLGLSFLDYPMVTSINLIDPSEPVIECLEKKLKDSYITIPDKLVIKREIGQNIKLSSASNIIFIAGMGGKEINEIILSLIDQMTEVDQLVISPHKNILELRKSLHRLPLGLISEITVQDEGRFYQILALRKTSKLAAVTEFGDKIWSGAEGAIYREQMIRTYSPHRDQLSRRFVSFLKSLSS